MEHTFKAEKKGMKMTVEEVIKEIEAMHILDFINFLEQFEKSSIVGSLLVEDWRKEDGENKQRVF